MQTGVFIKIYNWQNRKLVYEIHRMIELEKYPILEVKNSLNLDD